MFDSLVEHVMLYKKNKNKNNKPKNKINFRKILCNFQFKLNNKLPKPKHVKKQTNKKLFE